MGQAKLYGKKASGIDIDGLIQDYYVYAGKKVSAGDFVEFINGVASQTSTTAPKSYVSNLNSSGRRVKALMLPNGNIFVTHSSTDKLYLYGIICTIDGLNIIPGTDIQLSTNQNTAEGMDLVLLPDGRVVIAHSDYHTEGSESTYYAYIMVCKISGSTITVVNDTLISKTYASQISASLVQTDKVLVSYRYDNNTTSTLYIFGTVYTIGTSSVSKGTEYTIRSASKLYTPQLTAIDNSRVLSTYRLDTNNYLYGRVCSVSGTTISTGTEKQISTATASAVYFSSVLISDNKIFIAHTHTSSNYYLYGIICTISSTTITVGTDTAINSTDIYTGSRATVLKINAERVFIAHANTALNNSGYLCGVLCKISGTSITHGADTQLSNLNYSIFDNPGLLYIGDKILIFHSNYDSSNSSLGYSLVAQFYAIDEINNIPTNNIVISTYETQVQKSTTPNIYGVAKTEGTGGTSTAHKDKVSIYRPIVYNYINFTSSIAPTVWIDSSDYLSATASNDYGEWSIEATNYNSTSTRASLAVDGNSSGTWYQAEFTSGTIPGYFTQNTPVKIKPTKITITYKCFSDKSKVEGYNGTSWVDLGIVFTKSSANRIETFSISIDEYFEKIRISIFSAYSNAPTLGEFAITSGVIKILSN